MSYDGGGIQVTATQWDNIFRLHEKKKHQHTPSISRKFMKHYLSFGFPCPSLGKNEVVPMDLDNTSPSLLSLDSRWMSLRDSLLGADVVGDTFLVLVVAALPPEKLLVQSLYFRIGILSVSVEGNGVGNGIIRCCCCCCCCCCVVVVVFWFMLAKL